MSLIANLWKECVTVKAQCGRELTQPEEKKNCGHSPTIQIAETFPLKSLSGDEFYTGKKLHCAKIRVTLVKITFFSEIGFFF